MNDSDVENTLKNGIELRNQIQEETELAISLKYQPQEIFFNEKALIILTDIHIPDDIKIGLSFGYKFVFPYVSKEDNFFKILSQIDKTIDDALPEARTRECSIEIGRILQNRQSLQYDHIKRWLIFLSHRILEFFNKHPSIFATRSDKGGHTVVMNVEDYDFKLAQHLNCPCYTKIDFDPTDYLIQKEKIIVEELSKIPQIQLLLNSASFTPECLTLPQFYGLPKIHKKDCPLRPITPTIGAPGYYTSKILLIILKKIFPRTDFHIKDSFTFVKFIQDANIEPNDVLVSFDVVSMYTNIPFNLTHQILSNKKDCVERFFGINSDMFETLINFTLKECMFFTALEDTYKQNDGLPMGSCLSPLIARIVMDEVAHMLLQKIPQIKFIKIFVDDTIAVVNNKYVDSSLDTLNQFLPGQMTFTKELEIHQCINFLNVTLIREDHYIKINWYKKGFASGRLLNYFSSHKRTTILNTAISFIENVLFISDGEFFNNNKNMVIETLRENSFPESLIMILMNSHYTLMKPIIRRDMNTDDQPNNIIFNVDNHSIQSKYAIYPQAICENRNIKEVLHKMKYEHKILTESTKNTKQNFITTRKTKIPLEKRGNLILFSKCLCGKKLCVTKTLNNENGIGGAKRIITKTFQCTDTAHAYKKVKLIRGLSYNSQTNYLLKYIQWMCRYKLDHFHSKYEFPTPFLANLLNNIKNPYKFLTKKNPKNIVSLN